MSDGRRTLVLGILNLCYACVLIWLAVTPSVPAAGEWFPDKLAHALAYGGETVLLYWVLISLVQPLTATVAAWLGTGALGMLTEILQALQRERSADPGDLMADMVGATIVIVAATLVRRAVPAARVAWR
jgi:VanZ family protein